nr:RNA-directed DNA polymerase, eukaryota [Tanacetum cinerariifolium]
MVYKICSQQLTALSDMMDSVVITPKEDRFVWSLENSGDFSVKSIRKRIDDTRFIGGEIGTRWIKSVPIKVNIMAWNIQSDALPSRFNISRRGLLLVECRQHSPEFARTMAIFDAQFEDLNKN